MFNGHASADKSWQSVLQRHCRRLNPLSRQPMSRIITVRKLLSVLSCKILLSCVLPSTIRASVSKHPDSLFQPMSPIIIVNSTTSTNVEDHNCLFLPSVTLETRDLLQTSFIMIILYYFHGEWFACSVKLISGLFSDHRPVLRSNPLCRGVRHQRRDEERHSRVVREGGDQGQGGGQPGGHVGGDSDDVGGDDDRPRFPC